jgi:hypothetical protein
MMRVAAIAIGALVVGACSHPPAFLRRAPAEPAPSDSLYWKALTHLDAANQRGSTDSAVKFLDIYLGNSTTQTHRLEALTLRRLARDAIQLSRVEAALQQAKSAEPVRAGEPAPKRDEEAVKEIQRLKDELAKANEELERIRKRLATPKPPTS